MSVIAAVGTDTYGGLSGFKRPVQGKPTRVPSNLPAFRGATNKPGQPIKTPAIKSSANKPDRKTNVLIPYARVTPVEIPADIGRTDAGDVLFVSKTRPGVPGYAHARESRLCGVDALNRWMSPMHWLLKNETGAFRYILVDANRVSDDWRKVPLLQEWTFDGICLSNDERNLYRASMQMQRDGQLYNIGIQGPCMINNGYVEEHDSQGGLVQMQQGQVARQTKLFAPGYMDHRVEVFGQDRVQVEQSWDFAADYQGPQYHTYPMQMFSREVRPMQELYVGLVATQYNLTAPHVAIMKDLAKVETNLSAAEASLAGDPSNPGFVLAARAAKKSLKALKANPAFKRAFTAKTAYQQMGWWNDETNDIVADKNDRGDAKPTKGFAAFRYVLFTSAHLWELANDLDDAHEQRLTELRLKQETGTASQAELDELARLEAKEATNPATMAAKGEPKMAKRRKLTEDPFDDDVQRKRDFKRMVGAWHVGKVLDMKAGKMPFFEGGPVETGYRLTVNLCAEWKDWRALRREYTPAGSAVQVCDAHEPKWSVKPATELEKLNQTALFQWPTVYDMEAEKKAATDANFSSILTNPNIPVSMDDYGKRRSDALYSVPADVNAPGGGGFDFKDYVKQQKAVYAEDYYTANAATRRSNVVTNLPRPAETEPGTGGGDALLPDPSEGDDDEIFGEDIFQARLAKLPAVPVLQGGNELQAAQVGISRLEALLAPVTASERAGNGPTINLASFVVAAPSAPTAAAAGSSLRRRAGNTPEPSPDRTGGVSPSLAAPPAPVAAAAPTAAAGSSLAPVIEAPSAPQAAAAGGKKRRGAAASSDVFSSIFGSGGDTAAAPQPLNPAHRDAGAGGSGASTGRSYQRRGKGGGSKD